MPQIGDRIKVVVRHWCRGNHLGIIRDLAEVDCDAPHGKHLVRFDIQGVGIQGRYLFLDEKDFSIL